MNSLEEDNSTDNEHHALIDHKGGSPASQDEHVLYERTLGACGFGTLNYIIVIASGWALASDSIEMQVGAVC